MKESKVLSIGDPIINGDWHNFEIEFENGDKGVYGSFKQPTQTYFKEGEVAKYTFEDGKYPKVKPITEKKAWTGNKGNYKKPSNVSFGVSYCKDLIIAGKLEMKDWQSASGKIINFMNKMES